MKKPIQTNDMVNLGYPLCTACGEHAAPFGASIKDVSGSVYQRSRISLVSSERIA